MVFVQFKIKKNKPISKTITYRPLKDIDAANFTRDLHLIDWESIIAMKSVDEKIASFNLLIFQLFDVHAPVKKTTIKDKAKPWLTSNVRHMMKLRDEAYKKYRTSQLVADKDNYKVLKHLVNSSLFYEKKAYFEQDINSNFKNTKKLWKNLKQKVLPNFKTTLEIPEHFNDPNAINKHFLNVPGNNMVDLSTLTYFEHHRFSNSIFKLTPVDENVIAKIIFGITSNAEGDDGITMNMILWTLPRTLSVITNIINTSFVTSTFPHLWKTALVRPIPKNSNVNDVKDLRPISILPYLSKILEKAVCNQMSRYLEENSILPQLQSGFRKGRSTNTALIDVIDNILSAQDVGMGTILALLDFSRAFDSINISLLLSKLTYYGFDRSTVLWFDSYLSGRTQQVLLPKLNGENLLSDSSAMDRGVPQGSILGPLLFILYSSDITQSIKNCKYHLYADDLQIYISFSPGDTSSAVDLINDDLGRIFEWSSTNSLVLNPTKSKYLILGSRKQTENIENENPLIAIRGCPVERVHEARNLGLTMDSNLHFENHVIDVVRSCFYRLKVLYGIRDYLSVDIRIRLCEALVLSKLNYCITAYGPCLYARTQSLIQRVQNACARYCFRIPPRSHVTPFLNKANILKMSARQDLLFASFLFGVIKYHTPDYLYKKLSFAHSYNRYATRASAYLLGVPRHTSAAFRGSFRYLATKCWNNLPPPVREQNTKHSFKVKYRLFLLCSQKSIP